MLLLAELVIESKLIDSLGVRAFRPAGLRLSFEQVFFRFLALIEVRERTLSKHEISLVRVVLDGSSEHHVALLKLRDAWPFHQTRLEFKLVKQVVP